MKIQEFTIGKRSFQRHHLDGDFLIFVKKASIKLSKYWTAEIGKILLKVVEFTCMQFPCAVI